MNFEQTGQLELKLFTEDELQNISQTGVFAIDNETIRNRTAITETHKNKNKQVYTSHIKSPNIIKIQDTCIEFIQNKEMKKKINFKELEKEARDVLEPIFEKFNLVLTPELTKTEAIKITELRTVAINQNIRKRISDSLPEQIEFPIKDFINRTNIQRIKSRFNEALTLLHESSGKLTDSWSENKIEFINEVRDDEGKIIKKAKINEWQDLSEGSYIPKFTLRLNKTLLDKDGIELPSNLKMAEFIDADITNKAKYVEKLILNIDREAVVNLLGVGEFGEGYVTLRRELRDNFRKHASGELDKLLRTFILVPNIKKYSHFTLQELQNILRGTNHKTWESFKKNIFLPAKKEVEELSEMTLNYELVPSSKNWTHIHLMPSFKKNRMGFEAAYQIWDYLAYYMAVQQKFHQKNNLTGKFQAFLLHTQSLIYLKDDSWIENGKTIAEWIEEAKKAYQVEGPLKKLMRDNYDILNANNLYYDDERMCLYKLNYKDDEDIEISHISSGIEVETRKKKRTEKLKGNNYIVNDPASSLRYINELIAKDDIADCYIYDFIPFRFAIDSSDAPWVEISDMILYDKYVEAIKVKIFNKKLNYFSFDDKGRKEFFIECVHGRKFKEINQQYIALMEKLSL